MSFDYEKDTRDYFKSREVAEEYDASFKKNRGLRSLRFKWIARRERSIIDRFLRQVPHNTLLDIPAGTGKLAPVFAQLGAEVISCDVSEAMLSIARREYKALNYGCVEFHLCDAERIRDTLNRRFDSAVCLRLLHRVPSEVKRNILRELAGCAAYTIASFGVDSLYFRFRRIMLQPINKTDFSARCTEPMKVLRQILMEHFEILDHAWVSPGLSEEIIFLVRSKRRNGASGDA